jgi:hypothetical protein
VNRGSKVNGSAHHDVIHIECASQERVQRLVAHMAEVGYELPRELPDWTFKRPAWMDGPEGSEENMSNSTDFSHKEDPYLLNRFLLAQQDDFEQALAEITR